MQSDLTTKRLLAASDLHGNHTLYRSLLPAAWRHRVAAIVVAGDLLGSPDGYSSEERRNAQMPRRSSTLFSGVVEWYDDFAQVEDTEIVELMKKAAVRPAELLAR